jgi:class 3 adenylate cyclase/predicted ATPase
MADEIAQWLDGLGLGRYAQAFADNDIDFRALPELSEDDLKELGLSLGHRRILQGVIKKRIEEAAHPGAPMSAESNARSHPRSDAELRQLTVLFCDLVGSTALSSRLGPEDIRDVIRSYQDACATVSERFGGFVAKFMGDGVLVYFGFPEAHEDDAERAVYAGLGVVEAVRDLNLDLSVRIGIATGTVVVGDIVGDGAAQEAAITGEAPNLAARLQEIAEPDTVVMGGDTRQLIGELFEVAGLGTRRLKGFDAPILAWRVVGPRRAETRFNAIRPASLSPLVGRDEEMEIMMRRWHRAMNGDGEVVVISGEPGIGKSRLAHAFQERIETEPHTPVRLQCSPIHANSAFFPIIDQLERAAGFAADDEPDKKLGKLETLLRATGDPDGDVITLFAELLSIPVKGRYPPLNLSPQERKERTLALIVERLLRMADVRPILISLEDAHWIDPTTLELADRIIEKAPEAAILMLITCRPEFIAPWIGRPRVSQLALNRLDQRMCAAMVGSIAGGEELAQEVKEAIVQRTDGVPLFVEELTRSILETGEGATTAEGIVEIPLTLKDSLEARLDRLGAAKETAQMGAVIGREFDFSLIAQVASLDATTLEAHLSRLVDSGLATVRGEPPTATYTFKHALVEETAYSSLLRSRRADLHGRIAEALESNFPELRSTEPELLAHHFEKASRYDSAARYWFDAGQFTFNRSAIAEAVAHLSRGLDVVGRIDDPYSRMEREAALQATLALALKASKGITHEDTIHALLRANDLLQGLDSSPLLFPVLFGIAHYYSWKGPQSAALDAGNQLLRLAQSSGDQDQLLPAHNALGMVNYHLGENETALRHFERSAELYDAERHRKLAFVYMLEFAVNGHFQRAFIRFALGYPDQAANLADTAVALGRSRQPVNLSAALGIGGQVLTFRGDIEKSRDWANQCIELSQRHGFAQQIASAKVMLGWATARDGDLDAGIDLVRQGVDYYRSAGAASWLASYLATLSELCLEANHRDEAVNAVDEGLAISEQADERQFGARLKQIKADTLLAGPTPDPGLAESTYRESIEIACSQSAKSWELRAAIHLARLWRGQGRTREARDLLAPIYGWFTEGFDTADLKEAKALLDGLA